jgi:signal transduction histidine kinase
MDGNSITDDRSLLLDQLGTLRRKVDDLYELVGDTDWRSSTRSALEAAFQQLNLAGDFILQTVGHVVRVRDERTDWRELAETLFETASHPMLLTDGQRVHRANDAAGVLFDIPAARLEERPVADLFEGEDLPDLASGPSAGRTARLELTLAAETVHCDTLRVDAEITALDHDHRPAAPPRYLWRVDDPADRDASDMQLQTLQKDAALGRMATGITHEFKNILGIITTWCELGLRDEECPSSVQTSLQKINHAADRGATLTESILTFGEDHDPQATTFEANARLVDNVETLGALLPGRIQVDIQLADRSPEVTFDRAHFDQVLLNLILNARDAICGTGCIECRTRVVDLDDQEYGGELVELVEPGPGEYVEVTVEDTGCGMDDDTLQEAAVPFYSTKRDDGGTGLGLPTVVELVSRAGGGMWLESEPEEGTTVHIFLPRAEELEPT